jgi:chemosensory pili system protein ChpE
MDPALFFAAIGLGIAFTAAPGAVNLEAARRGLARGYWAALRFELGSLIGDATWAIVALAGVAFLIQSPAIRFLLGLIGAGFLFFLAWTAGRGAWTGRIGKPANEPDRGRGDFAAGALVSLANPFALAFWLGLGGTVAGVGGRDPGPGDFALFLVGFLGAATAWCFAFSALVAGGRRLIGPAFFRWINVACALVLAAYGLQLLVRVGESLGG